MANRLTEELTKILVPIVGGFVAEAMLKRNCRMIGTTPERLSRDQLPALAASLEKSVGFFTDGETARTVAADVLALQEWQPS